MPALARAKRGSGPAVRCGAQLVLIGHVLLLDVDGLKSPVTLYLAAGLEEQEHLELEAVPDFTVLPKPFHDLRHVYEQAKALGREDLVLSSISVLVSGLRAELEAEINRGKPQPSGRRRQAS